MARPQIQLPGVIQASPQASPTSQFVQAQGKLPLPKHVLNIAPFSQTLTGIIAGSQQDAHERSLNQGRMDATYVKPFGAATTETPEGEANRKAFLEKQKSGEILASEDPWYRIGVFEGEGWRAGLTVRDQILNPENLAAISRVYDAQGNFIPFDKRPDLDQLFNQQAAVFLNIPALQNEYGQAAAQDLIDDTRAEFHSRVSALWDAQTQQYNETMVVDRIVEQIERGMQTTYDKSPEGRAKFQDFTVGLHDVAVKNAIQRNVLDAPRLLRQAVESSVERAATGTPSAPGSPAAAVKMIDMARQFQVGPTTIEGDNSEAGLAFRQKLDALEEHYDHAAGKELERQEQLAKLERSAYLRSVDDGISEGFASEMPSSAVYDKLMRRIDKEVEPRYRDEARRMLDAQYAATLAPKPDDPRVNEEVQRLLNVAPAAEIVGYLDAQVAAGNISSTQRNAQAAIVEAKVANVDSRDDVSGYQKGLSTRIGSLLEGRSTDARIFLGNRAANISSDMMEKIRTRLATRAPDDTDGRAAIVREEGEAAYLKIEAEANALVTEEGRLRQEIAAANDKGQSAIEAIRAGASQGVFTDEQVRTLRADDDRAANVSRFLGNDMVQQAIRTALVSAGEDGVGFGGALSTRAQTLVREFYKENRPKMTETDFEAEFTTWANSKLITELEKSMGTGTAVAEPVNESQPSVAQMVAAGIEKPDAELRIADRKKGDGLHDAIGVSAVSANDLIGPAAEVAWAMPEGSPIQAPGPLNYYIASYGRSPAAVRQARIAASEAFAKSNSRADIIESPEKQSAYRKALLSTGFATPEQLLAGSIVTADGRTMLFDADEVSAWTTQMFPDMAALEHWNFQTPDLLDQLAAKYGIDPANEKQMNAWLNQQQALIEGAERSRGGRVPGIWGPQSNPSGLAGVR